MDRKEFLAAVAQFGTEFSPELVEQSNALLAPVALQPDESRVTRDIAYGPHARHRLDLFRPQSDSPAPCLLFVHDGGFVMGDKGAPGAPFYNNVGAWAQREGLVGVTINYRLAPEVKWPAGREDTIAAVRHVAEHAAEYGIDPKRIILMGHSAGANHVADTVAAPGEAAGLIAGAVISAGFYDLAIAAPDPFKPQYLGEDPSQWGGKSSLPGLLETDIPCMFLVGGRDFAECQQQAAKLVDASLEKRGSLPHLHVLAGHNHITDMRQLGSPVDSLGPLLADFIAAC